MCRLNHPEIISSHLVATVGLQIPRHKAGALDVEKKNSTASLRSRRLCGLTIIGICGLLARTVGAAADYNPDGGNAHSILRLISDSLIVARIFARTMYLEQTKTLHRVAHGTVQRVAADRRSPVDDLAIFFDESADLGIRQDLQHHLGRAA